MNIQLVIARKEGNLEWLSNIKYPYRIYNKGVKDIPMSSVSMPDLGGKCHSFIHHIFEVYNNLADITVFTCSSPYEHYSYFADAINQLPYSINKLFKFSDGCYGISNTILQEDENYTKKFKLYPKVLCEKYFIHTSESFQYAKGSQYVVYKQNIHNKPREWYKNILVNTDWNGSAEQELERIWPMIFERNNRYRCKV